MNKEQRKYVAERAEQIADNICISTMKKIAEKHGLKTDGYYRNSNPFKGHATFKPTKAEIDVTRIVKDYAVNGRGSHVHLTKAGQNRKDKELTKHDVKVQKAVAEWQAVYPTIKAKKEEIIDQAYLGDADGALELLDQLRNFTA